MKVLLINGSPAKMRGTHTALNVVGEALKAEGIEVEEAWIGADAVRPCVGCGACSRSGDRRCVFADDVVNSLIEKMEQADGLVVGSPVYYAGANGALLAALDRMFYAGGSAMRFKPAAAVAVARRAGTTPTIDQINKYFQINCMPVVSSVYWPMVHARANAEEILRDEEGVQTMRTLGRNMAWLLKAIEVGREAGIEPPAIEPKVMTNFIR